MEGSRFLRSSLVMDVFETLDSNPLGEIELSRSRLSASGI